VANAGFEDFSEAEDVGDGEADEDGPEDVFDVGEGPVVGFGVEIDIFLEEFAGDADDGEEGYAGDEAEEFGGDGDGGILRENDCVGHFLVPFFGGALEQ